MCTSPESLYFLRSGWMLSLECEYETGYSLDRMLPHAHRCMDAWLVEMNVQSLATRDSGTETWSMHRGIGRVASGLLIWLSVVWFASGKDDVRPTLEVLFRSSSSLSIGWDFENAGDATIYDLVRNKLPNYGIGLTVPRGMEGSPVPGFSRW